jgi:hypothetical protein
MANEGMHTVVLSGVGAKFIEYLPKLAKINGFHPDFEREFKDEIKARKITGRGFENGAVCFMYSTHKGNYDLKKIMKDVSKGEEVDAASQKNILQGKYGLRDSRVIEWEGKKFIVNTRGLRGHKNNLFELEIYPYLRYDQEPTCVHLPIGRIHGSESETEANELNVSINHYALVEQSDVERIIRFLLRREVVLRE